jgi:hypothetical protein
VKERVIGNREAGSQFLGRRRGKADRGREVNSFVNKQARHSSSRGSPPGQQGVPRSVFALAQRRTNLVRDLDSDAKQVRTVRNEETCRRRHGGHRAGMAVEEQICEVPTNSVAETRCEGACVGKDVAAKSLACVDTAGEDFAELDDLEHVDVTGGTLIKHLPETAVNDHDHDEALDCDPLQPLHADQLNPETHLSASATPDKAREIDIVTQRIALLHEHLQKSNVSASPLLQKHTRLLPPSLPTCLSAH